MTSFYNFVMHVFFGDMAAKFIGWQNSPFQAEVGIPHHELVAFSDLVRGVWKRLPWDARRPLLEHCPMKSAVEPDQVILADDVAHFTDGRFGAGGVGPRGRPGRVGR